MFPNPKTPSHDHITRYAGPRPGFTLVELLIVIGIILLLATMTMSAVNLSVNNDKVRGGARQVQSYLAGARDRAIYAGAPRGVRFLLDPANNRTVSSMIFIKQTDPWTQGQIQLERLDLDNDGSADSYNSVTNPNPPAFIVRGFDNDPNAPNAIPTGWNELVNEGLLYNGARIKIPNADNGTWYTVTTELLPSASLPGFTGVYYPPRLHLTTSYAIGATNTIPPGTVPAFLSGGPQTYSLDLPNSLLPGAEPVLMPKGAVIHLDRCTTVRGTITGGVFSGTNNLEQIDAATLASFRGDKLPSAWKLPTSTGDPSGFDYTTQMDVLFSPRGVVIGTAGQRGIIELYIADQKDADRDRSYWAFPSSYQTNSAPEYGIWSDPTSNGYSRGDKVILSLFTRTGAVSTHAVASNTVSGGTTTVDPFKFAETGEVAGK